MINNYPFDFEENVDTVEQELDSQNRVTVTSYIRFLHASPGTQAIDIYLNGRIAARNLTYTKFTEYMKMTPGNYNVQVYPTGNRNRVLYETRVDIPENTVHTISVIGKSPRISIYPILEPIQQANTRQSLIRFINLSPDSQDVDLAIKNDGILFKNVSYKEITGYKGLNPRVYNMEVRDSRTRKVLLNIGNVRLAPNRIHSIYLVGLVNDKPGLQALIPLDGSTYLKF